MIEFNKLKVHGMTEIKIFHNMQVLQYKKPYSPRRDQRSDNYSKIDFEKSHVLADISSTRERHKKPTGITWGLLVLQYCSG